MNHLGRRALLVSLALNLTLAAGLVYVVARPAPPQTRSQPMFRADLLRRALPPDRAALMDTVSARHRQVLHTRIASQRAARDTVRAALAAEPFDPVRLQQAFADLREAENATAQEAHALIADLATAATQSERARLADLAHGRGARRGHRHPDRSR